MRKIVAIMRKQWKETLKNKEVLIQFILFPVIAVIMTKTVKLDNLPADYFVVLFASMYIGMAPLTSMASIISEEKETSSLRILKMSGVRSWEYLLGVGSYIFLMCLIGSAVFALVGGYHSSEMIRFMVVMGAGVMISMLIGAMIGTGSKSQMNATAVVVPVMMVFSFIPMIAAFNKTVEKVAKYVYSQQISTALSNISKKGIPAESIGTILVSMLVAAVLFGVIYHRGEQQGI